MLFWADWSLSSMPTSCPHCGPTAQGLYDYVRGSLRWSHTVVAMPLFVHELLDVPSFRFGCASCEARAAAPHAAQGLSTADQV